MLRRGVAEFASAAGASDEVIQAIALGVSEIVTNVVVHAYDGEEGGEVRVSCHVDGERFIVEVADEGAGIGPRRDSPGIGHGLAMVGALAQTLDVAPGLGGRGTAVTMAFGPGPPPVTPPSLETLCALALETVADVSCVDLVHEGVLRRLAAEVADDPALTTWLRSAVPPAKPGTATWSALREGGARLVVHDPTVPRSPGGTGERLNLAWWIAVPLENPDGTPAALWGLGGRRGGPPVPPPEVIRIFAHAARGDLAQPAERALLRGRLARADASVPPQMGRPAKLPMSTPPVSARHRARAVAARPDRGRPGRERRRPVAAQPGARSRRRGERHRFGARTSGDVPASGSSVACEMQVPPDHLDAFKRIRKAEADHRPGHVLEIADPLLGECLGQLGERASLPWHRADAHVLEVAVDSHPDRTYRALQSMADGFPEGGEVQGPAQGDRRPR